MSAFAVKGDLSRSGSVAIVMGIMLPVLIGMVGLGVEVTLLLYERRQMQTAADSAALGAAAALVRGYPSNIAVEADAIAASLGFVSGTSGATVTVNQPPLSGSHAGNSSAVEVIVSQPQRLAIASYFTSTAFTVSARAVALQGSSGSFCVLATNNGTATAVSISNGGSVTLNQCSLAVNATGSASLSVTGGATLIASSISAAGQVQVSNGASISASNGVNVNQPATADPYANAAMPTASGCTYNSLTVGSAAGVQQLYPGTYCNGLSIGNGAAVSLNPGIYYIESGSLSIGGGTTVTGYGVTIVLTKNTSNYATVAIGNGATVSLTAPAAGSTAGILFFGDRSAPASNTNSFGGGATVSLTGAIYFPTQSVSYSNGVSIASQCLQLIAWNIQFSGGVAINSNCTGIGVSPIGGGALGQLVE